MPSQSLTYEFLKQLQEMPQPEKKSLYFDTEISGFVLEVRPTGSTYYYRYRDTSKALRMARIGKSSEISLTNARIRANDMREIQHDGGDPASEFNIRGAGITFEEFVKDRYMPFVIQHKRSWETDEIILRKHILPIIGKKPLKKIRKSEILEIHHASKAEGYAAATCNRILIIIRYIFNCAIRWEFLKVGENPTDGIPHFEDHGARERYLTALEAQRLFRELDLYPNKQVATIIKLLLYTGARKSELLNARWEYVDLEKQSLLVPLSKSGKARYIALSDAAVEIIRSLPRDKNIPWLFYNKKTENKIISLFRAWKTIRQRSGLPGVRLHDLRHSFASFLVNSGRTLYEVQKLLGHYDSKVTMRYAHLADKALIEAANIVDSFVSEKKGPQVSSLE